MDVTMKVVGYDEEVKIGAVWNEDRTKILELVRIEETTRTKVQLETPSGAKVWAEVSPSDYEQHIVPLLDAQGQALIEQMKAEGRWLPSE